MDTFKPLIFIGSSKESESIASEFQVQLGSVATPILWSSAPEFQAGFSTLDGLLSAINTYDFAAFILAPDDISTIRNATKASTRDNVVYEMGLFLGALGQGRVFYFLQESPAAKDAAGNPLPLRIPTDLDGINIPRISANSDFEMRATVSIAANSIRGKILEQGRRKLNIPLMTGWHFDNTGKFYSATLNRSRYQESRHIIGGRQFILAARLNDPRILAEDDTDLVLSPLLRFGQLSYEDLIAETVTSAKFQAVQPGDRIEGYLLMTPEVRGYDPAQAKTLGDFIRSGCQIIDSNGVKIR